MELLRIIKPQRAKMIAKKENRVVEMEDILSAETYYKNKYLQLINNYNRNESKATQILSHFLDQFAYLTIGLKSDVTSILSPDLIYFYDLFRQRIESLNKTEELDKLNNISGIRT